MKTPALVALSFGFFGIGAALAAPVAQAQVQPTAITSAVLSRGYNPRTFEPSGVTSSFKSFTGKIHCTATMNRFGTVTAGSVWIAVDAGGKHNYAFLQSTLPKQKGRIIHFAASLPRPWPAGKYRVDLFLNGKLVRSIPYTVTS